MGLTKTEIFTDEQNRLAIMVKALAHPARIAILQQIMAQTPASAAICLSSLGWRRPPYPSI